MKIRGFFHSIYKMIGHILCRMCLIYWRIRDYVSPPITNAVLFVAHPDDDTLFFHSFIKEHHPYVVLMTTGWSLRRMPCFLKAMKRYGVRFRAYDLDTRDERTHLLELHVKEVLALKSFTTIATHNSTGEYGHMMHRQVHEAVTANVSTSLICPVPVREINEYPLPESIVKEKESIFHSIYTTELFVLEQYRDWVINEKLEEVSK